MEGAIERVRRRRSCDYIGVDEGMKESSRTTEEE